MSVLQEKLRLLPDCPGVYIMLDREGTVIYVGKARVLKNRVRQYFHTSEKPPKVRSMVENVADFSYIVAPTEADALALENTLIKKYVYCIRQFMSSRNFYTLDSITNRYPVFRAQHKKQQSHHRGCCKNKTMLDFTNPVLTYKNICNHKLQFGMDL